MSDSTMSRLIGLYQLQNPKSEIPTWSPPMLLYYPIRIMYNGTTKCHHHDVAAIAFVTDASVRNIVLLHRRWRHARSPNPQQAIVPERLAASVPAHAVHHSARYGDSQSATIICQDVTDRQNQSTRLSGGSKRYVGYVVDKLQTGHHRLHLRGRSTRAIGKQKQGIAVGESKYLCLVWQIRVSRVVQDDQSDRTGLLGGDWER